MTTLPMMSEREKLVRELVEQCMDENEWYLNVLLVADFILADRARIVEPLVEYKKKSKVCSVYGFDMSDAIDKTLSNAGVSNDQ
jgi:hypothetical protein